MKIFTFLIVLFFVLSVSAQKIDVPKVDKRVELVGIVFRLAETPEYSEELYKDYTDEIQKHFGRFKNHKAVALAKELHRNGAGYSYVASLAVHLRELPDFKLVAPMNETDVAKFGGEKNIENFLAELKNFYRDSKFEEFWAKNQPRFSLAEKNFERLARDFHPEWFDEFYGRKFEGKFKIVIGLGNGSSFYGPSVTFPDNSRHIYAVFAPFIEDGEPHLPSNALTFTVHEFNHSFANPLIDKYAQKFETQGKKIFQKVEKEMTDAAYGTWRIMMYESFVRAATNVYLLKYNPNLVAGNRANDMFEQNFLWSDAFTDLLVNTYEKDRKTYPDLDSFVPKMSEFFTKVSETDLSFYRADFEAKCARVEKVEPFENGASDVDSRLTEIRIVFDKPLDGKGISIYLSRREDAQFPEILDGREGIAFVNGNRELTMKVKLKPNTRYGFILSGAGFRTADGYPLKDFEVSFKTK